METPDEMIASWKRFIKKARREEELETIKIDLEAEKDMFEETVSKYDELIGEVENKIEKIKR